jgi:hypothetical protein
MAKWHLRYHSPLPPRNTRCVAIRKNDACGASFRGGIVRLVASRTESAQMLVEPRLWQLEGTTARRDERTRPHVALPPGSIALRKPTTERRSPPGTAAAPPRLSHKCEFVRVEVVRVHRNCTSPALPATAAHMGSVTA